MDWSEGNQNFYFEDNKVMNVNVAQHGSSETSYSAYTHYGRPADGRSSRGWNEAEFSIDEDWESGKNIEDQWDSVFRYEENGKEVEMVTVSAWNEWLAWKYNPAGDSILYVDNFNNQFSRDLEMDRDYYQDNFYLQLVRNVRKYKYGAAKDDYEWEEKTVSSLSDFDKVQAKYKDFVGDARVRDFYGFDIRTGSKEANLLGVGTPTLPTATISWRRRSCTTGKRVSAYPDERRYHALRGRRKLDERARQNQSEYGGKQLGRL